MGGESVDLDDLSLGEILREYSAQKQASLQGEEDGLWIYTAQQ